MSALPFLDAVVLGTTMADDVARARAFVDRKRVICPSCGEDDPRLLVSVHRRPRHPVWDAPVARLVQLGVSNGRLLEELAKCDTRCRRCHLARLNRRPQMLRVEKTESIGLVAKAATTSGGGRKPPGGHSRETVGDH